MNDIQKITYIHKPWRNRCIFTGTYLNNQRGEHVLPRWLVKEYDMNRSFVKLGSDKAIAKVREFKAPACQVANNQFGKLEERIKQNQEDVSDDELHLWLMKVASGMLWNHVNLAQNIGHPNAPIQIDERFEGILSQCFQKGFSDWKHNKYLRNGSLVRFPGSVNNLFLAQVFGSHVDQAYGENHDAMLPYAMIIFGRPGYQLLVATFFDDDRVIEDQFIMDRWNASSIHNESSSTPVRAALAAIFYEKIVRIGFEKLTGKPSPKELFPLIAYSLGVEFFTDDTGVEKFRERT